MMTTVIIQMINQTITQTKIVVTITQMIILKMVATTGMIMEIMEVNSMISAGGLAMSMCQKRLSGNLMYVLYRHMTLQENWFYIKRL